MNQLKILHVYEQFPHPFSPVFVQQARLVSQHPQIDLTVHGKLGNKEFQAFCPTFDFRRFGALDKRLLNKLQWITLNNAVKLTAYERHILNQDFDIIHLHQSFF